MKTIDISGSNLPYHPLIVAMEEILTLPKGESIEIISDDRAVCKHLKDYLISKNIGFREIYKDSAITLQFKI